MVQEVPASAVRQEKEKQIGKEEIIQSLFTNNMTVFVGNPKQSTQKAPKSNQ